jgi:transposase-like protein
LRPADEFAARGKTGEEIAGEPGVTAATLYNWRRADGGMDTDNGPELVSQALQRFCEHKVGLS